MAIRLGHVLPMAAMLINVEDVDASSSCVEGLNTARCPSAEVDELALFHFTHAPVRRSLATSESAAGSSRMELGGKWKLGGEWTPNATVAKLKMLTWPRERMKAKLKKDITTPAVAAPQKQKNLFTSVLDAGVGGKWKLKSNERAGFDFSAFSSQQAKKKDECVDTDNGAADRDGDVCWQYTVFPQWCGGYDDDDFNSLTMCCACNGQAPIAQPEVPPPQQQPPPLPQPPAGPLQPPAGPSQPPVDLPQPYIIQETVWWPQQAPVTPPVPPPPSPAPPPPAVAPPQPAVAPPQPLVTPPEPPVTPPQNGCVDADNGAADVDGDACWAYSSHPQWCGGYYDDDDFLSGTMCCSCGGGSEPSSPPPPALPPPPQPPSSNPRQTMSGCECQSEWTLTGEPPCADSCCNPDEDPGGEWCAVVDANCQGANWGYCGELGFHQPSSPPPPLQPPSNNPRQTTSGCECRSEWTLTGEELCPDGCCNPDQDPGGEWCAVVDANCQGANWGYCESGSSPESQECVDIDEGSSDEDGDVCWQYSVFTQWCNGYDDDDFTSSVMCCACGGGDRLPSTVFPMEPVQEASVCTDMDGTASDINGDYCWAYSSHSQWCGDYDDDDFISNSMCCACGGGSAVSDPVPQIFNGEP